MQSPSRGWRWDGDRFTQLRTTSVFRLPGDSAWYRFYPGAWRPVQLGEGALVLVTCLAEGLPSGVIRNRSCVVTQVLNRDGRKHFACKPAFCNDTLPTVVVDATTVTPVTGVNELEPHFPGTPGPFELPDDPDDDLDDKPGEISFCEFNTRSSASERYDDETPDLKSTNPARYDPTECLAQTGLVWHTRVTPVLGADLKPRDVLDSLDHSGARRIYRITPHDKDPHKRIVAFSDVPGDTVVIDMTATYDVVDPTSAVTPDGTPIAY